MILGVESARAGFGIVLACEIGVLGGYVACRTWWLARTRARTGTKVEDEEDDTLVGEKECGGGHGVEDDVVEKQKEKGDGDRIDRDALLESRSKADS